MYLNRTSPHKLAIARQPGRYETLSVLMCVAAPMGPQSRRPRRSVQCAQMPPLPLLTCSLLQCLGSLVIAAASETTIAAGSPGKAPRWRLTALSWRHCLLHCSPPAALLDACCTSRSRAARTQASNSLCGGRVPAPAPSPSPHPLTRVDCMPHSHAPLLPHPFRCHRCGRRHERHCPCSQSHRRR